MGSSSRPRDFDPKQVTPEQAISYFTTYLEKWRTAMDLNQPFYLAGHSFGGYLAGNYAVEYPQNVKRLLLLSPIGFSFMPEGWGPEAWDAEFDNQWSLRRSLFKFGFRHKYSPFDLTSIVPRGRLLNFISGFARRHPVNSSSVQILTDYMYQIFSRPGTSEYGLMVMFEVGIVPRVSLSEGDRMGDARFKVPLTFIYGD